MVQREATPKVREQFAVSWRQDHAPKKEAERKPGWFGAPDDRRSVERRLAIIDSSPAIEGIG
jgi:hypothetical protein